MSLFLAVPLVTTVYASCASLAPAAVLQQPPLNQALALLRMSSHAFFRPNSKNIIIFLSFPLSSVYVLYIFFDPGSQIVAIY
jgi:hypothetical protein